MREIRARVASGDLARIPGLIRSMQRLWPKTSGLYIRRETEARLFEKGPCRAPSGPARKT